MRGALRPYPLAWERGLAPGTLACRARLPTRCGCGEVWLRGSALLSEELLLDARVAAARITEVELTHQLLTEALEPCPTCGVARSLAADRAALGSLAPEEGS